MASSHDVFGEPSLLRLTVKRAAYSDRTALLMAEMSKLAYTQFEKPPDSDPAHDGELDQVAKAIWGTQDSTEARSILVKFAQDAPAVEWERASRDLAAKLADGGFELINTYTMEGTQAFLAVRKPRKNPSRGEEGIAVLSFRGTEGDPRDWKTNLTAYKQMVEGVPIHTGFLRAFRLVKSEIRTDVGRLASDGYALYLTGHSLGGALALIATREIGNDSTGACYTFGSPNDIVPRVPPVFLPTLLKIVALVTPMPFQKWVVKAMDKFVGYVHHGDMRYPTRS